MSGYLPPPPPPNLWWFGPANVEGNRPDLPQTRGLAEEDQGDDKDGAFDGEEEGGEETEEENGAEKCLDGGGSGHEGRRCGAVGNATWTR